MKYFLEVIVHWRMIILHFTYIMWPVNAGKKKFPLQVCEIFLFQIAWKTTSCERKNVFAMYDNCCAIDAFPLGVFSIRNFNLCNLKGNGNTPTEHSEERDRVSRALSHLKENDTIRLALKKAVFDRLKKVFFTLPIKNLNQTMLKNFH